MAFGFPRVTGHGYPHVGQAANGEQVFQRLVRLTVRSDRNAAMRSRNQNVEVPVADGNADLVQVAPRRERTVGAEHRQLASLARPPASAVPDCSAIPTG